MAFQIIWSPSARWDLVDIKDFISWDRPEAAKRFVSLLFQEVEHLAGFPLSGRIVPEFVDDCIREVIKRPCRIVYRVNLSAMTIEVIRVWHSARGTPDIY